MHVEYFKEMVKLSMHKVKEMGCVACCPFPGVNKHMYIHAHSIFVPVACLQEFLYVKFIQLDNSTAKLDSFILMYSGRSLYCNEGLWIDFLSGNINDELFPT